MRVKRKRDRALRQDLPTEGIHDLAARGFERAGDDYERGRPSYPAEAIEFLVGQLGIGRGSQVLDLAAGTGKLTRQLVPTGARLVAVEPVAGMRGKLAEIVPAVLALDGTAEAIPLEGESVDAVCCAQAFHWFDADRGLEEIHRVLRPGGGLGLIWNVRDESVDWERRLTELMRRYESDDARPGGLDQFRVRAPRRGAGCLLGGGSGARRAARLATRHALPNRGLLVPPARLR